MNKKEKRGHILHYFLSISQHQEHIQDIQNRLVTHIRFNPLTIFKKITDGGPTLSYTQFKTYVQNQLNLKDTIIIKKYFHRHFQHTSCKLQDFTASLLPYTPNILREVGDKIDKQMQTKHSDHTSLQLYHQLLETELKAIYEVCLLQRGLNMEWSELKKFIKRDIHQYSQKLDCIIEQCSILNVRKWMELWANIDEYKILNIMRWFGGSEEKHLQKAYENNMVELACTCPRQPKHLPSQNNSQRSPSIINKLSKVRSEPKLGKDSKSYVRKFLKYIETIIKSERRLSILREGIRPYRKQTQLILHQLTSKKHPNTKLTSIINKIDSILQLKPQVVQHLLKELDGTHISNSSIFSLFSAPTKHNKSTINIRKEDLLHEIFQVLYTFCLSKATLKSIARDLYSGVEILFNELDEHHKGELDKVDLKLILKDSNIKVKQSDIVILMNHFGDGEIISLASLKEVISIQKNK